MTLAGCGNWVTWPDLSRVAMGAYNNSTNVFVNNAAYALNATNTKQAYFVQVPKSGNITGIAFALVAMTTDQQVRVGVYNLDASGNPDGASLYKGSAVGDDAIALATGAVEEIALGTQCTSAVAGDWVAVVFEWVGTQGDIRLAVYTALRAFPLGGFEGRYAGSWARSPGVVPTMAFKYDDNSYASPSILQSTVASRAYHANTAGADEYGLKIVLPFKARCVGVAACHIAATAASLISGNLYSGTTLLASGTCDHDAIGGASTTYGPNAYLFATPQTLAAGTYYASLTTDSTSVNITMQCPTVGANAHFGAWPGGAGCYQVKRLDGGSWSEVNTEYTPISLILDQLDDGAGGGGGRPELRGANL
jgi:hypothetical protein